MKDRTLPPGSPVEGKDAGGAADVADLPPTALNPINLTSRVRDKGNGTVMAPVARDKARIVPVRIATPDASPAPAAASPRPAAAFTPPPWTTAIAPLRVRAMAIPSAKIAGARTSNLENNLLSLSPSRCP